MIMGNIVVVAPKLINFTAIGIFQIIFGASKLHNVNIKLPGCIIGSLDEPKEYYEQLPIMLPGIASAKILNLELETIEALSSILDFLAIFPSPFYNLKYVKLPHGFDETRITDILRSYLLGGSPTATIVTTLPKNMIPHTVAASVTPQNVVLQETLVSSENITLNLCVENVDMGVQEERIEQNSVVIADNNVDMGVQEAPIEQNTAANVDKVKQIGT
ncbi:hypothetical protein POM88_052508 [Heracleum sosnowskyi]|uniref:Uncharacterized protein n=1 Tax=Heracleum sosnowskyi TaxID=360622 RepID=A0AAD8LYQ7_9APIA|nr:hypothetical protein POM88_052508 [Heracleum sosnowskyi]